VDDHFDDHSSPNSPVEHHDNLSRVPPLRPKSPVKKRTQDDIDHCEKEKQDINTVLLSLKAATDGKDAENVKKILETLIKQVEGSRRRQKYYGRQGACQLMPYVLRKFIKVPDVCDLALQSISLLCRSN
jgi:hypothetical protein